jgi:hypothetical protein
MGIAHQFLDPDNTKAQATHHGVGEVGLALEYKYLDVCPNSVLGWSGSRFKG